jgi:hypothetical protein
MIKAPLDGKNVTTDWIEEVFDFNSVVWNGNKCVGFIKGTPVLATWEDNRLQWDVIGFKPDEALDELVARLSEFDDNDDLEIMNKRFFGSLIQHFYWKDEQDY